MTPLPCPFCGEVPASGERQSVSLTMPPRPHSNVTCENVACYAQPYIADYVELPEAIRRWNMRDGQAAQPEAPACNQCGRRHGVHWNDCPTLPQNVERAAVVKYLRAHLTNYERSRVNGPERTEGRALLKLLIDAIEKGEHHK